MTHRWGTRCVRWFLTWQPDVVSAKPLAWTQLEDWKGSRRMLIHAWSKRLLTVKVSPNMLQECIRTNSQLYLNILCSSPWGRVMSVPPLYVLFILLEMEPYNAVVHDTLFVCFWFVLEKFLCILKRLKQTTVFPHSLKTRNHPFFKVFARASVADEGGGGDAEIWSKLLGSLLLARQCCKHPVGSICSPVSNMNPVG